MPIILILIVIIVIVAIALPVGLVAIILAPAAEANTLGDFDMNPAVFNETGMQPNTIRVGRAIAALFPEIETIGGYPGHPTSPPDHGSGQALDVMIPQSTTQAGINLGNRIAEWLMDIREDARIVYLQWRGRIWNYAGRKDTENAPIPPQKWRIDDRDGYRPQPIGSGYWTHAHMDHLHVAVDGPIPIGGQAGVPQSDWKGRGFTKAPPKDPPFARNIGGGGTGGQWLFPVAGASIGSKAGWRFHPILHYTRCHAGSDIGASWGTPIRAAADGTVIFRGWSGGYGNFTKISHGGGVTSHYGHQSSYAVSNGQRVRRGQVIGYVGSTGMSSGPHLHFEVFVNGQPYDPAGWVGGGRKERVCV